MTLKVRLYGIFCDSFSSLETSIFRYEFIIMFDFIFHLIEIANVADNLSSLEEALDLIEERADRIREQLLQLLTSNREIRQSLQEENDKLREEETKEESNDADTSPTPENNKTNEQ